MTRRPYGSGSIREKRPGYWELRVMTFDPVTRRPRQVSQGFRGNRKAAQQRLGGFVDEVSTGRHVVTEGTVGYLMRRWIDHVGPNLADNTRKRYQIAIASHVEPALGDLPLRRLRPSDLDALYDRMRAAGSAPASIQKVHTVLRRALDQARRWGWIPKNPAADATPPSIPRPKIRPPAPADIDRLLKLATEDRPKDFGPFLRLAVATGARRGELCALRWEDFDLAARCVVISRSVTVAGELKGTKTHAERRLALDGGTVAALEALRRSLEEQADEMGATYSDDAFLFSADPAGTAPWNPSTPTHLFMAARAKLGLPNVRLHDLRHYSVTHQLGQRVPVPTVAARHGHADANTTLRVYGHFLEASDRQAAEVMGRLLAGATDPA